MKPRVLLVFSTGEPSSGTTKKLMVMVLLPRLKDPEEQNGTKNRIEGAFTPSPSNLAEMLCVPLTGCCVLTVVGPPALPASTTVIHPSTVFDSKSQLAQLSGWPVRGQVSVVPMQVLAHVPFTVSQAGLWLGCEQLVHEGPQRTTSVLQLTPQVLPLHTAAPPDAGGRQTSPQERQFDIVPSAVQTPGVPQQP